ncbi:hypothetical protein H7Y40_03150 [Pedobacter sp.]|nr:hypothetical protein [Candidatus Saccharibacteria bacterium]
MKDIDFDELDRAVSSALGNKPTLAVDASMATTPIPVPSETVAVPVAPVAAETMSPRPVITPSVTSRQASPAVRRGGRFMDVVHPSSDMKTSAPVALRAPKRTFSPVSDDMKLTPAPVASPAETIVSDDEVVAPYPTLDTLSVEPAAPAETVTEEPEAVAAIHAWPDPLDLDKPDDETKETVDVEPAIERTEAPDEELLAPTSSTQYDDSSQTPFLPDTQVDKRPLGAFAEYGPEAVLNAEVPSFNADGAASLAAPELGVDLIAIESDGTSIALEQPGTQSETAPEVSAPVEAQPASIPQQYHAAEKATDTDLHSVFDTSAYHQPLLPQKTHGKSRAWVWVLIIVCLLVVGAGLGALFFMAGF